MSFDAIHNFYEYLVTQQLQLRVQQQSLENDEDFLGDVACVALNQLPARYVRHDVDMAFYMTQVERDEMHNKVSQAIDMAVEYVQQHRHDNRPRTINQ